MLSEITGGLRLAQRRAPSLLSLATMVGIACLVLSLILGDVLTQVAVLKGGLELRQRSAVAFSAYYPENGASHVSDDKLELLVERLMEDDAYTSITSNVQVDDPTFAHGRRVVVVFGEALRDVFPDLELCSPTPCGMVGAGLPDIEDSVLNFAGRQVALNHKLPSNATFFDPNIAGLPLDRSIVLFMSPADLRRVNALEREEALTKTILLEPDPQSTDSFVAAARSGGLLLVPKDVSVTQNNGFRDMMIRATAYIAGLAAFLLCVLIAFVAVIDQILLTESRAFIIRRIYGAGFSDVAIRIGVLVGVTALAIPTLIVAPLQFLEGGAAVGARWTLPLISVLAVALWAWGVRRTLLYLPRER